MLVGERMTPRPITVTEDTSLPEALELMRKEKIRRLPVLDKHGKLVGIVTELDLLRASPSPATTLSIYEMPYLLSKVKMREIMTREMITVTEDTPIEEAARIMADHKIGGLPVMRGDKLVGIITETDIFKLMLELFGARRNGIRITLQVPDEKGVLARVTGKIAEIGGNILSLGTAMGEDPSTSTLIIRVADVSEEALVDALNSLGGGIRVTHSRTCPLPV
ncbi:MAG: CBS and ACT domain-containing protein [Anaerolineae bacterium]|nr:CBS and ACT domain-containing protein [Anaerolineae bacterium]MDW8068953.1 CBS and ACT domain-containing protein [Anaerolineae bacterium]